MCGSLGEAQGVFPLPDGQRWCGSMGAHVPDSRRQLQAAILESTGAEVRKVWRPGRRPRACPRRSLEPAELGNAAEVSRLADEVAKRGRQGQHHRSGARPSGLRGDEQCQRSAHRGGEPGWRMRVSKAGVNVWEAAGMAGIGLQGGTSCRKAPDRTARCLSLKPYWGKPPVRHFRGGGWKRGCWVDEAPAP
jgi:hypothetical protein